MSICAVDVGGLWTARDSEAVDEWAMLKWRTPLEPDLRLWDLLAGDRAESPHPGARPLAGGRPDRKRRPTHCVECFTPMRHRMDPPSEGWVIHSGRGICTRCSRSRSRGTA